MKTIRKYLTIFRIYFSNTVSAELSFRLNFFLAFIGGFCFVALHFFLIYFLMQKVHFGRWTQNEMLVLLGNFYILTYSLFFLFWRGFIYLIRNIRNGIFDYYLIWPADSQFMASIIGGGVHNLFAITFGLIVIIYGLIQLHIPVSILQVLAWLFIIIISILDCYSYILLLVILNFRFGYLEEILNLAFTFQEISRYPTDAFLRLPIYLLIFTIPLSALTTIPATILIAKIFPMTQFIIFIFISFCFIFTVRKIWLYALKSYTSSG
jgi:ABC-2 type transport system permease protein